MTEDHARTSRPFAGRRGFTLVELLTVIAIIAILVSLLMPTLGRAKYLTRVTACLSNTHQQCQILGAYAAAYNGQFAKHLDNSPEYLRSHSYDPDNNVIDNMKRWGQLESSVTICPLTAVFGHRYEDTTIGGDYGGIDAGHPNCLGPYMWMANYDHWNGVLLAEGEEPIPTRWRECGNRTALVTHRISLLDPYIRDIGHEGRGLVTESGSLDFYERTTSVDQPVGYADGHTELHTRDEIKWRFTIPGVGDYWY